VAKAQATGDPVAPWRALGGAERFFSDEADLLVELHAEWLRILVARLHRGQVVGDRTPANVRDLYEHLCAENPTLRGILDTHGSDPALRTVTGNEHAMLARIAGLAPDGTLGEAAATRGRSLLARLPVQRAVLS
jgi:hypothetical protein